MLVALAAGLLVGGCSQVNADGDGGGNRDPKTVPVRVEAEVEKRVAMASSQILDIIALKEKAKAKDSMPFPLECSGYSKESKVQRVRHTWSVWGAADTDLRAAMDRLRERLPTSSWKIVKDGLDDSRVKAPQVVAESADGQVAADLRLHLVTPGKEYESAIVVTVSTKCFRPKEPA
ncbi:hypothetical protein [Streptomyces sp. NPDC001889]